MAPRWRVRHPLLLRPYVEATTIAQALVCPDFAQVISRRALYSAISADCLALCDAIAAYPDAARRHLYWYVENDTQRALVNAALEMTVGDLTMHSVTVLIALVRGDLHDSLDDDQQAQEVAA